ncbi:MAG: pilus assembly PilX N-terminal domain-containing protein, partial [Candidatus Margulisbacteria bacterium]|nr:pilus assembly PilX N-terminal domain-containing protein [Candidatus Margulisiibacteriota bacterium]
MKNKKGFALLTVIFIVLVFAVVGAGLVYMFVEEGKLSVAELRYNQAFYVAEAGRHYAVKRLASFNDWTTSMGFPMAMLFDDGAFIISTSNASVDSITITSTGLVTIEGNTYSRTVRANAGRSNSLFGGYGIYSYGSASGDLTTNIGSNAVINGSIFVNADLYLNNNVAVNGDAAATGNITGGSGVTVTGETDSGASLPSTTPTLETSDYDDQIAVAAARPAGDVTYSGTNTLSNCVYVNGNVTVSNNARIKVTGTATIVATGVVNVANNVVFNSNLSVIADGVITIQNNVDIGQNAHWYSSTGIQAGNNAEIGTVLVATGAVFLSPGDISL